MISRMNLLSGVAAVATLATLCAWGGAAFGQAASGGGESAASASTVGEVIVTAQRRSERLQDVPIAVSSFNAKDIERQQLNGTSDIARLIPNMVSLNNTGTGSGNVYYLRGLGQTESFATFDPQVGTYVDDIYVGRVSAANFGLFDVDQIQVLRGPQGTLFGRNSTGGAIVVTLAQPAETFGGYVDFGYGIYNRVFGKASINLPLGDQVFTKTSFYGVRDDGYVNDVATGQRLNAHGDKGVRESVLIKPRNLPNVTWSLSADTAESTYNAEQNSPVNGQRVSYSGFGDLSSPVPVINGPAIVSDINGILKQPFTNLPNGEDLKTWGAMSNLQVKFDAGTLNIITGLRGQDQLGSADFPFPAVSGALVPYDANYLGQFGIALNSTDRQYSQEVKWSGNLGSKLTYTAGLFYLYEENSTDFIETLTLPEPGPSVFGLELSAPEHFHNTTYSEAAYAQGDYHFTDQLTLTLGGRFTDERKYFRVNANVSADGASGYDTADVNAAGNRTRLKTDQFTPRVALQYKLTPDIMAFVSATRGFQGGGWNSLTASAQTVTAFDPETVWTYETGLRTQWFDHKLTLNGNFFYNNVDNYQLITLGPGSGNFVTENAASMVGYGFEADAAWRPIDELTLGATLGLQNGFYFNPSATTAAQAAACRSGVTGDCTQGIVGPRGALADPQNFPHATVTTNAAYVWKFPRFDLTPSASVQFTSSMHVDTSSAPAGVSGAHALLDMGLKFHLHDARWYLTAECQNCFMTNYETALLFVKYYNSPGIWDVKLHLDF
jgi:iron complex outermembrane receptor protein